MEISFYLHPKVSGLGTQSINIDISYGKEPCGINISRMQTSTGVTVQTQKPNNWDPEKGRIKSTEKNYINKNRQLLDLEKKASDIIAQFNREGKRLDKVTFKELLKDKPKSTAKGSMVELVKDCRYYFNQWAHNNKNEVSPKHVKNVETQLRYLEEFFPGIKPGDINERLVTDFKQFLMDKYDQLDVSQAKATNMIKKILDEAGLKSNYKWLKKKASGNSQGIVLDLHEQELIRQWQPETVNNTQQRTALSLAKDLMLFLIATGPRYVDLKNLDRSEVKKFTLPDGQEIRVLEYYQIKGGQKRGRPCRVVLNEEACSIIDKYKDTGTKLLPVPSNQKLNPAMRDVARLAGIDAQIKRVRYQAGRRMEETFEKWQVTSCHRCRATLATNLFEGGADAKTIQDALGHDDPKTTQGYVRNKDSRQYEDMLRAFERLKPTR